MKFLITSPKLHEKRPRALMVTGVFLLLLGALLFLAPAPYRTMAEGVVWLPDNAAVRVGTSCFVRDYTAQPDGLVEQGETLIACEDPLLRAQEENHAARLRELKALLTAQWRDDRVAARITGEEIKAVEADLNDVRVRLDALSIQSPIGGRFIVPQAADLPGRYVNQGEVLGYVVEQLPMTVRVVVPESDAELVRSNTGGVLVQLANRLGDSTAAVITRRVPGGSNILPSSVLGKEGGGSIDIDPRDSKYTTTFSKVFEYDLALPPEIARAPAGTRVYVRFDHGSKPLGYQWYRQARQVFLGRFGV